MCDIVADVAKYTTAKYGYCNIPVPIENGVSKLVERSGKCEKQCRRHDETFSVHWEVMMNSMENEMGGDTHTVIWKVSDENISVLLELPRVA